MLFPTVEYAVFFLVVLAIAWALTPRLRAHKTFLLLASYVFYGFWSWTFVPLLFAVSVFAYGIAKGIQRSEHEAVRKRLFVSGIAICLLVLAYFKYTSFLLLSLLDAWGLFMHPPAWNVPAPLLPLGISFFMFHAISLMFDVYRRKLVLPVTVIDVLLYIAFFPQLIAGPILRASKFIPQLAHPPDPQRIRMNRAFLLILAGLFKKVVLSNTLSERLVEPVFAAPANYHTCDVLLGIYGYAAQIYCDFSGYTDIAIGCALLLGYHFPRNFNAPYTATDPQDFWQRWHISLSSWLRDYLYIPLGGSRKGTARTYVNLIVTMLLGGLWHGASWTFVIWGGLQGLYLVAHRLWASIPSDRLRHLRASLVWRWAARLLMFHAVCAGWVFFRAQTFDLAMGVFRQLGSAGVVTLATAPALIALACGIFGQYMPALWRRMAEATMARVPVAINGAVLAVGIFVIELLGPTGVAPFIYFRF